MNRHVRLKHDDSPTFLCAQIRRATKDNDRIATDTDRGSRRSAGCDYLSSTVMPGKYPSLSHVDRDRGACRIQYLFAVLFRAFEAYQS